MTTLENISALLGALLAVYFVRKFIRNAQRPEDYSKYPQASSEVLNILNEFISHEDGDRKNAIVHFIREKKLIPAIKVVRELTNLGLKEAKELTESIAGRMRR